MNATAAKKTAPQHWRITSAFHVVDSLYDLELESDDGDLVEATVSVGNRASRSARHEPADKWEGVSP